MIIELILFFLFSMLLSSVGLGGGVFYVPLLLAFGYSYHIASSTSLFLITITGASAFSCFHKARLVDWKLAMVLEGATGAGAFTGGITAAHISAQYLKVTLAFLLISAAVAIWQTINMQRVHTIVKANFGYWQRQFNGFHYSVYLPATIPVMFAIGYLSGTLGIAGGMFKIPIMILCFNIPAKIAVATSSLMVGLTGLLGFGGHLITGTFDWKLSFGVGLVVLIGAQCGSKFSVQLPEKKLKKLLAVVLISIGSFMLVKTFGW